MSPFRNRVGLELELKPKRVSATVMQRIVQQLRVAGFGAANVRMESFHATTLLAFRGMAPDIPLDLISYAAPAMLRVDPRISGVIIPLATLRKVESSAPGYAERVVSAGRRITTWNVNSLNDIRYVVARGVTGYMSDRIFLAAASRR